MQQKIESAVIEAPEFIGLHEAAAWLGLPLSSVREYVSRGLLPSYKLGRHRLFRKRELLDSMRARAKSALDDILR
jgi:excisionase family DNA binding protein